MMEDNFKGHEIARFPGYWADDKKKDSFFKMYPFLPFITVPMVLAVLFLSPKFPPEDRDLILLVTMPFVLGMCVGSYFLFEMVMTGKRSPIIVYSNGIEHKGGYLDRFKHRPDFIPKASIQQVEVKEHSFNTPKGDRSFVTLRIRTREGREKFISTRPAEKMKGLREALSEKLGVTVKDGKEGSAHKVPVAPSYAEWRAPIDTGVHFCDKCGENAVEGAAFCGRCGKML